MVGELDTISSLVRLLRFFKRGSDDRSGGVCDRSHAAIAMQQSFRVDLVQFGTLYRFRRKAGKVRPSST